MILSGLIKCFVETYKDKATRNRPALILKSSAADFSPIDRGQIISKIEQICNTVGGGKNLPNIYLVHGDLTNEEMNSLYNHPKVKAHITFTKGEGFGRPLAEASLSEKVIVAPNWSGQVDFLKHSVKLEGQLTNVHPSAVWENVILPESQWFSVNYKHASDAFKYVSDKKNQKQLNILAKRQARFIKENVAMKNMEEQLIGYLEKYASGVPTQVALNLPKLKKKEPELNSPKLKLPKLKKVES